MNIRLYGVCLAVVGCGLAACGGSSARRAFTYTPVPYTVVADPHGTPVALWYRDDGALIDAGLINALVRTDRIDGFTRAMQGYGFSVDDHPSLSMPNTSLTSIHVPSGSVQDAIKIVKKQDGVISASFSSYRKLLDEKEGGR